MGIISSIGENISHFAKSLNSGNCGIGFLENKNEPPVTVNLGAKIKNIDLKSTLEKYEKDNRISPDFKRKILICAHDAPFGVQVSVLSALEAGLEAQLIQKPVKSERVSIVAAGSNLNPQYGYGLLPKFKQEPRYLTPKYAIHYMDTDHVGTLSEIFQIQGEGFSVGGASASGNLAIIKGYQLIQLGIADMCLVIGGLSDLSPLELQGYYNLGAMGGKKFCHQPEKACRPFDKDHEGFIYGQAGGCLVLESLDSAKKRGVRVLAEITAGAINMDGNRLPNPNVKGEAQAMESAINLAGLKSMDIDYINAHGTSSPLGDETEIKAIKQVFNKHIDNLWINSTKGLTGHCLTSAGVIECIATIIQINEGFIHPNLNLENPIDEDCRLCGSQAIQEKINLALSNSFGFGGINTSILLRKGD